MKTQPTAIALLLTLVLGACATPPTGGPGRPAAGAGAGVFLPSFGGLFGSGLSPALEAQRGRLAETLKGTPVAVEATADKRLRVEVPGKFSFDPGLAVVKPPLAAVLDQLATGFKPHAAVTELRVAVPVDDKAPPLLLQERSAAVRDYLVGRGVPLSRIVATVRAPGEALEIALNDRPLNK